MIYYCFHWSIFFSCSVRLHLYGQMHLLQSIFNPNKAVTKPHGEFWQSRIFTFINCVHFLHFPPSNLIDCIHLPFGSVDFCSPLFLFPSEIRWKNFKQEGKMSVSEDTKILFRKSSSLVQSSQSRLEVTLIKTELKRTLQDLAFAS